MSIFARVAVLALASSLVPFVASAQRRPVNNQAQASTAAIPAVPARITVATVNLRRADVDAAMPAAPATATATGKKSSFGDVIGRSLKKAALGDDARIKAARTVLQAELQKVTTDPSATVIAVIGTADDLKKVQTSLELATRRIVLAFVDRDVSDDTSDNTALSAGIVGGAGGDKVNNVWVYLPRRGGAARSKPDQMLPLMAATPTAWNALFAADGDQLDVEQLRGALNRNNATSATAPTTQAAGSASTLVDGDIVTAKIAGAKVYVDAAVTSTVAGSVTKTDELVVQGSPTNGMVMVIGANATGWIQAALLTKAK